MKKIVLIEPKASGFHIFSKFALPRLGLPILGTMLKNRGYDVTIYCQDIAPLDWSDILTADLVGISSITATMPEALKIATKIKNFEPDIPVVMGGPHVTFLPEEALRQDVDFVVRGEGEETFPQLITWLEARKQDIKTIAGLSYKIGNQIIHNPQRKVLPDLDSLPFPDLTLIKGIAKKMHSLPLQTSRGCPFDCSFCVVFKMFGRKCRFRSEESVLEEINSLTRQFSRRNIFFYDDNFVIRPVRTKSLLRKMIARELHVKWSAQVRVEVARDEELMRLMRQSGCSVLYIGFESVNPTTLKQYHKSQQVKDIKAAIRTIHQYGIKIHGMFVLGGDDDTLEVIKKTVDFSLKNEIDTVQFMILTPLPGSDTYKQLMDENRIINFDWGLYDGHHGVFQPKRMSAWQLQAGAMLDAMPKFYSTVRYYKEAALGLLKMLSFVPSWKGEIKKFALYFHGHKLLKKWRKANQEWLSLLQLKTKAKLSKGKGSWTMRSTEKQPTDV